MKKEQTILIRIEQSLKNQIQDRAELIGLNVSSFIKMVLIEKLKS